MNILQKVMSSIHATPLSVEHIAQNLYSTVFVCVLLQMTMIYLGHSLRSCMVASFHRHHKEKKSIFLD